MRPKSFNSGYFFALPALLILLLFWFSLKNPLFNDPSSTVLEDIDGELLGARIAGDGQWRFPPIDSVPEKYKTCLLGFEDRYFYYHRGVNPLSIFRALIQNFRAGEIVSGGSTISMQVIRLSRNKTNYPFWDWRLWIGDWRLSCELSLNLTREERACSHLACDSDITMQ